MGSEVSLSHNQEPIAIIGIGCRFPGGIRCPRSFWKFLCEGGDGITEVPPDRWDINVYYDQDREKNGKIYTRKGGFLDSIDLFDPQFFGISPREASYLDPQQRILLEVAWEALEDGGLAPETLKGSKVGVFVGVFMHDYENIHCGVSERRLHGPHSATGMSTTIAANRLSYAFDFRGPSLVVDTACSSSLVAVHLAGRSLLNGEADLAIAGGVNLLIRPEMTMVLCKGSFLSPDGYCKSFDARANGYTRSEGAGIVVLKRLSHAVRDNDPIYAVISGSAVNQDGRSDGITVPTVEAQVKVIREALAGAGRSPEDIRYVEAHGTGTPVGDPIEARAIATALTRNRSGENRCVIGSVKSNIGHTESAAGIAGLIKTALILKHGIIPPNLHFETPNPNIPFDDYRLRVLTAPEPWPSVPDGSPRIAGVNSFGFGGTNAHAIVESVPAGAPCAATDSAKGFSGNGRLHLIPLSARSPEALEAVTKSSIGFLNSEESADVTLNDLGFTRALRRGHHSCRLAVAVRSKEELAEQLNAFLDGEKRPGMSTGQLRPKGSPKLAFVFSGMGQQWPGMGWKLYETEPVFRAVIEECDAEFRRYTDDWSLVEALHADNDHSRFGETQIIQPCIFAVQIALAALFHSRGVVPESVVGHSVGEIAAAHVAGVLTLANAARISFHRSRLQQRMAGRGAMLAVGLTGEEAERLLGETAGNVSIAAVNSPGNLTLSGDREPLEDIAARLERKQVFARFLNVDVPFHSAAMDSILPEFRDSLAGIEPREASIPLVSTVTGKIADGSEMTVDYWLRNVRNPVLFADALDTLIREGHDLFLEMGAHPVLSNPMQDCLASAGVTSGAVLPTLRRNEADDVMFHGSLGRLYTAGYPVDWRLIYGDGGRLLSLPAYPWQRERYWLETGESQQARLGKSIGIGTPMLGQMVHPLLGGRLEAAVPTWNAEIDARHPLYLGDHVVQNSVVFPAAAYVETAQAAAFQLFDGSPAEVRDIEIKAPLLLGEDETATVQCTVGSDGAFSIYSRSARGGKAWSLHAGGMLERLDKSAPPVIIPLDGIRERVNGEIPRDACYERFRTLGLEYGPRFQGIERIWTRGDEALGLLNVSGTPVSELAEYHLHPVVLDACFQIMAAINTQHTYLPVQVKRLRVFGRPGAASWCHARLTEKSGKSIRGDLQLVDERGFLLAEVTGLKCRRVEGVRDVGEDSIEHMRYEYRWTLDERSAEANRGTGAGYLPAPGVVADLLRERTAGLADVYERDVFNTIVMPEMHVLSGRYVVHAFTKLGWSFGNTEPFTAESLSGILGVKPEHRLLFGRLLEILEEDGILKREGHGWKCMRRPADGDPADYWRALIHRYPACHAELTLLHRCGSRLSEVLRGEEDPLSLIFPKNSPLAEHLYHDSPSFRFYNRLMQLVMSAVVDRTPEGQPLRILEIGAGTGAMAMQLLRVLPGHRTRYVFTDISRAFTAQAEQKFRSTFPGIDFLALDIEKNPEEQGFPPHSFDIVLASDVLHATSDLRNTLVNIKRLLAPGGLLLLLEITKPHRWFDLVFGLLSGWWLFADRDIRPSGPLLSQDGWRSLISSLGFPEVETLPGMEGENESQHSIFIARAPRIPGDKDIARAGEAPGQAMASPALSERPWLLLGDGGDLSRRIAGQLRERGVSPVLVIRGDRFEELDSGDLWIRPDQPEDFRRLIDTLCPENALPPVVIDLIGIDAPDEELSAGYLEKTTNAECTRALTFLQTLMSHERSSAPDLWLVTGGVEAVEGSRDAALAHSPLWGFARVMNTEFARLQTRIVDLSRNPTDLEIGTLCDALLSPDAEDELMIRGENRYIRRLTHRNEHGSIGSPDLPCRLHTVRSRGFDAMSFHELTRRKPGPGEVEIQVRAAGLNFKDVAKAAGLLDNTSLANRKLFDSLGMECSGVVVDVGEGVDRFAVGDEIMGAVSWGFASHTTIDPKGLVKKPAGLSFEEAATIPIVFLASSYALNALARVKKGDRVLIHSAAGGIGLSAIQIAQSAGAEIFATAGTPEKRDYLRALGISYVGDSRSMAFVEEIMEATNREGIDIVLNTLPAKTIAGSMSLLKPVTGKFIDLSNMYEPSLTLDSLDKGISFHSFDLEGIVGDHPDLVRSLWKGILDGFSSGAYHPLPYRVFSMSGVASAFSYLKKGMHIGKVIITMKDPDIAPVPTREGLPVHADGSYLISGGLGGFGLAVARWLVACGARNLVLLGRRGASSDEARAAVESLRTAGARVAVECVDVTDERRVRECLDSIEAAMPPLRGIIHAAMVLNDAPLMRMTGAQIKNVLDPKILGAWNLHVNSLNKKLDFFICFSSIASLVGNADQGNYVAANYFLEALVRYRRAWGLPALAINWGPIAGAGYVAEHDAIREHLKRQGVGEIPLNLAWQAITYGYENNPAQVGILTADWNVVRRYSISVAKSPRFALLVSAPESGEDNSESSRTVISATISPEERQAMISQAVAREVAAVLGISRAKLDLSKPLDMLGIDSLMAVELVIGIETATNVALPKMVLLRPGLTVNDLVGIVEKELLKRNPSAPIASEPVKVTGDAPKPDSGPANEENPSGLTVNIDSLSDDEVDSLLNSLLSGGDCD